MVCQSFSEAGVHVHPGKALLAMKGAPFSHVRDARSDDLLLLEGNDDSKSWGRQRVPTNLDAIYDVACWFLSQKQDWTSEVTLVIHQTENQSGKITPHRHSESYSDKVKLEDNIICTVTDANQLWRYTKYLTDLDVSDLQHLIPSQLPCWPGIF